MRNQKRHLKLRGDHWHYVRRVPNHVSHLDTRGTIRKSLKTTYFEVAAIRRDALEEQDDLYWASLLVFGNVGVDPGAKARYKAAQSRAMALGVTFRTVEQLVEASNLPDLYHRVAILERNGKPRAHDAEALLGGIQPPPVVISQALEDYITDIAPMELRGKSQKQVKSWEKVKRRALQNFVKLVGDKPIDDITREDAVKFYDWWRDRVTGKGERALSGNSANRDMGNMRKLYRLHYERLGEDRPNPFRGLNYSDRKIHKTKVLPFTDGWLQGKILAPGALTGLNRQARLIVIAMVETGCRPSELCNLVPEHIFLNAEVPYIKIDYRPDRAIKTDSSVRDVPLVGMSLEAMRLAPDGFPRYIDKEDSLSAVLMKHFRVNGLLPSSSHRIYSIRHSFENRMKEEGIDLELRMLLMGHSNARPEYGDGGSMEYRRDQMKRIAFDVPEGLFDRLK